MMIVIVIPTAVHSPTVGSFDKKECVLLITYPLCINIINITIKNTFHNINVNHFNNTGNLVVSI